MTWCLRRRAARWIAIGATFVRDIEAGEVVVVNEEGIHSYKMPGACHDGMCIFEFIYFARPDSVIDGSSVPRGAHPGGQLPRA